MGRISPIGAGANTKPCSGYPFMRLWRAELLGVIDNRQPYGNAVIIETPLENLPAAFFASLAIPTPAPTVQPAASLFCPADPAAYNAQRRRSLYLLYAHLNKPPLVTPGQAVSCGQTIGEVGTTGKSVNPHLHLETRVGPAGAHLSSHGTLR